jgi:hypothetical protein
VSWASDGTHGQRQAGKPDPHESFSREHSPLLLAKYPNSLQVLVAVRLRLPARGGATGYAGYAHRHTMQVWKVYMYIYVFYFQKEKKGTLT